MAISTFVSTPVLARPDGEVLLAVEVFGTDEVSLAAVAWPPLWSEVPAVPRQDGAEWKVVV